MRVKRNHQKIKIASNLCMFYVNMEIIRNATKAFLHICLLENIALACFIPTLVPLRERRFFLALYFFPLW